MLKSLCSSKFSFLSHLNKLTWEKLLGVVSHKEYDLVGRNILWIHNHVYCQSWIGCAVMLSLFN